MGCSRRCPSSLTRQILQEHLVDGELKPGSPISLRIDQALLQDATGTMALMQFEELGVPRVKVERAVQYVDHNVVQLDYKNPDDHRMLQALARKYGLHFSRPGNGISHYIHMERYGKPGQTMLGADSHTTQAGCLGMIAIGAGGLDVAVVLGGYPYEISCPEIVEVRLEGDARSVPGSRPRTSSSSCCAGSPRAAARTRCSSSPGPGRPTCRSPSARRSPT